MRTDVREAPYSRLRSGAGGRACGSGPGRGPAENDLPRGARGSSGAGPKRTYVVRPGDTLWSVAQRTYSGDPRQGVWEIQQRNHLASATIVPGEKLVVP